MDRFFSTTLSREVQKRPWARFGCLQSPQQFSKIGPNRPFGPKRVPKVRFWTLPNKNQKTIIKNKYGIVSKYLTYESNLLITFDTISIVNVFIIFE